MGAAWGERPDEVGGRGWVVAWRFRGGHKELFGKRLVARLEPLWRVPTHRDASGGRSPQAGRPVRDGREDSASAGAESAVSSSPSPFLRGVSRRAQLPCDSAAMCYCPSAGHQQTIKGGRSTSWAPPWRSQPTTALLTSLPPFLAPAGLLPLRAPLLRHRQPSR